MADVYITNHARAARQLAMLALTIAGIEFILGVASGILGSLSLLLFKNWVAWLLSCVIVYILWATLTRATGNATRQEPIGTWWAIKLLSLSYIVYELLRILNAVEDFVITRFVIPSLLCLLLIVTILHYFSGIALRFGMNGVYYLMRASIVLLATVATVDSILAIVYLVDYSPALNWLQGFGGFENRIFLFAYNGITVAGCLSLVLFAQQIVRSAHNRCSICAYQLSNKWNRCPECGYEAVPVVETTPDGSGECPLNSNNANQG